MIWWILAGVAAILLFFALNTFRHAVGISTLDDTPKRREERLESHWRILRPEGSGPFPAAILLSGCDGVRDNMTYWAERFVASGRLALIVDSHTPRGLDQLESWRLVCAGQALPGAERAGDLAVALNALGQRADVTDDVVVLGASHGGWTAMEFVAEASSGEVPPGLTKWPAPPESLLESVTAMVLLYPYCGLLNGADKAPWPTDLPVLMVLAEEDRIVDTDDCLAMAETLHAGGAKIETEVLAGAGHGFDQQEKSPLSSLTFDASQRDHTETLANGFLRRVTGHP
ncbi:dienelactone hydrolase family protein [Tropicimonas sp. TH_r6]|uniref:dienelactone hydrolase family protein n=1 Tax=Tropicimonas sp. TH_r6 TaxID=3082085 RepID=UPI0029547E8D|nr:dienelactone hydrolase family protein [Tropicimonas sp. TH_r6]MDV7143263.1 dienelactone hydrolase family protein [Tropicimonas sp. TH_r6]